MSVTVKSYRPKVEARIMSNLEKGVSNAGMIVASQAKKNVTHPLPSGKTHRYKDTDELAGSIASAVNGVWRIEKRGNEISVLVGTKVKYGLYLEFGHADGSRHYPWLFPAAESKKNEIKEAIKKGGSIMTDYEVVGGIWDK